MLHRLSVGNKLNTLLIAALLGAMTISGLALYSKYQRMLEDRRATLQNAVQVALGVLDFYDKQVKAGRCPRCRQTDGGQPALRRQGILQPIRHAPEHGLASHQTRA